jgi:hypothetical protein
MTISTIDESQRKAARVMGFTFLFAMAIVVLANYGINFRLVVPGNAVDTARNIMAHETLFGCTSPRASTRTTLACRSGGWPPRFAATFGSNQGISREHWLPSV